MGLKSQNSEGICITSIGYSQIAYYWQLTMISLVTDAST